jgi:hypothetical protein
MNARNRNPADRRRYAVDDNFFADVRSDLQAYLAGFIAADGCVSGNRVVIGLASIDAAHLDKIAVALAFTGPVRSYLNTLRGKKYPRHILSFASRRIVQDLARLGIGPRKSLTLVPWDGPAALMPAWWRGMLDGDGSWIHRANGSWSLGFIGSPACVAAFTAFVSSLTGDSGYHERRGNVAQVSFSALHRLKSLAGCLYDGASLWLDRKRLTVENLMLSDSRVGRPTDLTAAILTSLLAEHGRWADVAFHLGISVGRLARLRSRLGVPKMHGRFQTLAVDAILGARQSSGSWRAAAVQLGMTVENLWKLRRKHGLTVDAVCAESDREALAVQRQG